MSFPVPAKASRPALSLAAVALALFVIARTTGSGWLIVILTLIAAVVVLAFVLPVVGLWRLRVAVEAPRDGTVGRTAEVVMALTGGSLPVVVQALGSLEGPRTGALAPCRGALAVVPGQRGVMTSVALELRSAAPLGLVWWRRRVTVALERPFEVGPMPVTDPRDRIPPEGRDDDGRDASRISSTTADSVKTIRDYAAGDPIKLVHWAATARMGELMVKELESPTAPALIIAVDLCPLSSSVPQVAHNSTMDVELVASRAAGLALAGLAEGMPVELLTCEAGAGPTRRRVTSAVEVGRRLARAVGGPLPPIPAGAVVLAP